MQLKYITDNQGQVTGVYIPINEWNTIKKKYNLHEQEDVDIPSWHMDVVNERLADYNAHPETRKDFDDAMDDIV